MFDVVNVLKVKKVGETDGDYVEQCDKAYPELEGYAVFCPNESKEVVKEYIYNNQKDSANWIRSFEKYPRNVFNAILEGCPEGSYTEFFVKKYGGCQQLLDAINGKESQDVVEDDDVDEPAEWWPEGGEKTASEERDDEPMEDEKEKNNGTMDAIKAMGEVLQGMDNKLNELVTLVQPQEMPVVEGTFVEDKGQISIYLDTMSPSTIKNAIMEGIGKAEGKDLVSVRWVAETVVRYLERSVKGDADE